MAAVVPISTASSACRGLPPQFSRTIDRHRYGQPQLHYVLPDSRAYEYAISVGRDGFNWTGSETVSRKQAWPDWHPPAKCASAIRPCPRR